MASGVLRAGVTWATRGLGRRLDPRASVTGKFVAAGGVAIGITFVVVAVAVWQATTTLAATAGDAAAIYRGGILAFAVVSVAVVVAFGFVERSLTRGLRRLDTQTRAVTDGGRFDESFEPTRRDEVGQLTWSVAELRDDLVTQVDTVESLNRELATTATAQTRTLSAVRRGDLTERMDEETGVPQFDALATSFNETMTQMETMVAEVREFSQSVADAAREADANADRAQEGTVAVTDATAAISDGVKRQHAELAETAEAMASLVERVDAVASRAETVADESETAVAEAQSGAEAATDALSALGVIESRTADSVAEIESLADTVADVGDLADRVRALTEQTEHLAMNAELEAKKSEREGTAGDGGDGSMTHLGKQIRALSNDTEEAAAAIEEALDSVVAETQAARAEIERTQTAVEHGTDTIEDALGAFETVESVVEETAANAARIDDATGVQAERAMAVRSRVDSVKAIGAETATEANDVAATARQQQAVIEAIERRIDWLANSATSLEEALSEFTVRSPDDTPTATVEGQR